jgi:hypothetical protein
METASLNQTSPQHPFGLLQATKAAVAIIGLIIALLGGLAGLFFGLGLVFSPGSVPVDGAVTGVAVAVLGLSLGGALAWHAGNALRQRDSALFQPLPVWLLLLLYLPVIALGQSFIFFDLWPALTLPPFHLLAAAIPSFTVLAFAGRAFKPAHLRWREVVVQFSGGALLATFIALTAEIILGLVLLLILSVAWSLLANGSIRPMELLTQLQDSRWLENPDNLQQLILYPPIAITLVAIFVVIGPLVEELAKLLGVILMSYRHPSPAQVFLWGLAGGAGFALVENLFNTTLALEAWLFIMLLRVGATAMHCLATGLTALGWQRLLVERRPWKLLGLYIISIVIHALWNILVIGVSGVAIATTGSATDISLALGGSVILLFLVFFIILALSIIVALIALTYRLRAGLMNNSISSNPTI